MSKTYGTLEYDKKKRVFLIECAPHVAIRVKRVFAKINTYEYGKLKLSATPENARDLEWFLERYPMEVKHPEILKELATQQKERAILVEQLLNGYSARQFPLKLPARDYQSLAANMWLVAGGLLLADDVGLGKAQTLSAKILTPTGWTTMGEIKVGDAVVDPDGGIGYVEGVYPQGEKEIFLMTTSDGVEVECCDEHLWWVQTHNDRMRNSSRVVPLKDFRNDLFGKEHDSCWHAKWFIPVVQPLVMQRIESSFPPYLLGCLLGDGSLRNSIQTLTCSESQIIEKIKKSLPLDLRVKNASNPIEWSFPRKIYSNKPHPFTVQLRKWGLWTKYSYEKWIPLDCFFWSVEHRIELLRGLMDTDGECGKSYGAYFSSTSKQLADGLADLVRSLGGLAKVKYVGKGNYRKEDGTVKVCRDSWNVSVQTLFVPFHLKRKTERWHKPNMARAIKKVESIGYKIAKCIKVSTKRHLYITDGYLPTHNTCTAIAGLTDSRLLPSLIVCPTHLPPQWENEVHKFTDLTVHRLRQATPYDITKYTNGIFPDVIISNYHKLSGWAETIAPCVKSIIFDEVQDLRHTGSNKYMAAKHIADSCEWRLGLSVGPDSLLLLRGGPFGGGWQGTIEQAYQMVLTSSRVILEGGYSLLPVKHSNIESRGWEQDGFCWKTVKTFIRHKCDKPVREIEVRGSRLLLTDDHSLFKITKGKIACVSSEQLKLHDCLPLDNGKNWEIGANKEVVLDIASIIDPHKKVQVLVDISGLTRKEVGVNPQNWYNFKKERKFGPRIPLRYFLTHRRKLPAPQGLYFSQTRGKARVIGNLTLRLSNWAYVLGFFLGAGWLNRDSRGVITSVSFSVDAPHYKKLCTALGAIKETPLRIRERFSTVAMVEIECDNKFFAEILAYVFKGAKKCWEKELPTEWTTTWSRKAREQLLEGLRDSDGVAAGSNPTTSSAYTTTSLDLAKSILLLLRSLGISGSYSEHSPSLGGWVKEKDGSLRQIQGKRISYIIGWSVGTGHWGSALPYKSPELWNQAPIHRIKDVVPPSHVYDLEMEGHPSFCLEEIGMLGKNSATPIYNYGGEMFNVLDVLYPGCLGTWDEFSREWVAYAFGDKPKIKDPKAFGVYTREAGLMLRRTRIEVHRELPEVTVVPHSIDCDTAILDKMKGKAIELAKLILAQKQDFRGQKMQAAGEFDLRMRQATGIAKAPYVCEFVKFLIQESNEPIVLFGWHREVYEIYLEKLKEFDPVMYTGSETAVQKEESKQKFIKGQSKVMIISLRSGAGLDGLQDICHIAVFGELDWSNSVHTQCVGRIHRDGQDEPVIAYYLLSTDGCDPIMCDVLGIKRQQSEGILNPLGEFVGENIIREQYIRDLAADFLTKQGVDVEKIEKPKEISETQVSSDSPGMA